MILETRKKINNNSKLINNIEKKPSVEPRHRLNDIAQQLNHLEATSC